MVELQGSASLQQSKGMAMYAILRPMCALSMWGWVRVRVDSHEPALSQKKAALSTADNCIIHSITSHFAHETAKPQGARHKG